MQAATKDTKNPNPAAAIAHSIGIWQEAHVILLIDVIWAQSAEATWHSRFTEDLRSSGSRRQACCTHLIPHIVCDGVCEVREQRMQHVRLTKGKLLDLRVCLVPAKHTMPEYELAPAGHSARPADRRQAS